MLSRVRFPLLIVVLILLAPQIIIAGVPIQNTLTRIQGDGGLANRAKIQANIANLPFSFIANAGQVDANVRFMVKVGEQTIFFTPQEVVFAVSEKAGGKSVRSSVVRLQFSGANENVKVEGENLLPGVANFLLGNNPEKWRTKVPTYAAIVYRNLYPDIDLIYSGEQGRLKSEFVVGAGVDPDVITMHYDGASDIHVRADGKLVVRTPIGELVEAAPTVYQMIDGKRVFVKGGYRLQGQDKVDFTLSDYVKMQPLTIDPGLIYSSYLGGRDFDYGTDIAVDSTGSAYVTGTTKSYDFPVQNPLQEASAGRYDVFVAKLNPSGSALIYSTYLGGTAGDEGTGIAVDSTGNAYITGWTQSSNFPVKDPFQGNYAGYFDAFVVKLNPSGSALVYSTYLGGTERDEGTGIAVDSTGNAYITGWTQSSNFPVHNPVQPNNSGDHDAFVAKLNPSGSALVYSTYLGGTDWDEGASIAVDSMGNAYITGRAQSSNFPVKDPFQVNYAGFFDAFVAKLNPSGSALVYSTYLGGTERDEGTGIAVDSTGNAYITGWTVSSDFPVHNPVQPNNSGDSDAFVAKLNPSGSVLVYSTYLGGTAGDEGAGIAVDSTGNAYITGWTQSSNFPVKDPFQGNYAGYFDAFVVKLNPSGSALVYSTYLGGTDRDQGAGIAVDSTGNAYITGWTQSSNFPVHNPVQSHDNGTDDAFIVKIAGSQKVGAVAGKVIDASTGQGIANATVSACPSTYPFPHKGDLHLPKGITFIPENAITGIEEGDLYIPSGATLHLKSGAIFIWNPGHSIHKDGEIILDSGAQIKKGYLCVSVDDAHSCWRDPTFSGSSTCPSGYVRWKDVADLPPCNDGCSHSTTTNSNGHYSLSLSEGAYDVTASADDYKSQMKTATVTASQMTTVDFPLTLTTTDTTPPALILDFSASDGENGQSTLQWTNPSDADLAQVIIKRKTTIYPTNHTDGETRLTVASATPGHAETFVDTGLNNGTTYYYAVFSRDAAGNWNDQVVEGNNADTGTPQRGNQPPDTKIETHVIDSVNGTAKFTWSGTDDKTPSAQLVYEYRLLNPDSPLYDWTDWSSNTTTTYPRAPDTHLPDGTYRFQVKAKDADGAIQPSPTTWEFTIGVAPSEFWVQVYNTGSTLAIRKTPGTKNKPADDVLKRVPDGWVLKVLSTEDESGNTVVKDGFTWWKVEESEYESQPNTGWVAKKYLKEVSFVSTPPSSPEGFTRRNWEELVDKTISWAQRQLESKRWCRDTNGDGKCEMEYCLRFVENAFQQRYTKGTTGYETANAMAEALKAQGVLYPKVGAYANPPRGALVFFAPTKYNWNCGHVGIYLGNGNIICQLSHIRIMPISDYLRYGGYEGWAYPPKEWLQNKQSGVGTLTASFTYSPRAPVINRWVTFDASSSSPSDKITSYTWNFDDGTLIKHGMRVKYAYSKAGHHIVSLTVTDGKEEKTSTATIFVSLYGGDYIRPALSEPPKLVYAHFSDRERRKIYKLIARVLFVIKNNEKIREGKDVEHLIKRLELLLDQIHPNYHAKNLVQKDLIRDGTLSPNQELLVSVSGALIGLGIHFLSGVPAPIAGSVLAEGAKMLSFYFVDKWYLSDLGTATVTYPDIGRLEIVWFRPPVNKILLNARLEEPFNRGVFITIPLKEQPQRDALGLYKCPLWWCGLTRSAEYALKKLTPRLRDIKIGWLGSPGELLVRDSLGNATGLVEGKEEEQIPNSAYDSDTKTVLVFKPKGTYMYNVLGTKKGTYSLGVSSIQSDGSAFTFTATEIPTTLGTDHQYTIDWDALARGEDGVTLQIDNDGDGKFERTIHAGSTLDGTKTPITDQPPEVSVLAPSKGEAITASSCQIKWQATDPDDLDRSLKINIFYSINKGASWTPISSNEGNDGVYDWDISALRGGEYWLKAVAKDPEGESAEATVGPFTINVITDSVTVAPNPVTNTGTAFFYTLPDGTSTAKLMIFNVAGKPVFETLLDVNSTRFPSAGTWNPVDQDGTPLGNGPYIYVLIADGKVIGKGKMVIQR